MINNNVMKFYKIIIIINQCKLQKFPLDGLTRKQCNDILLKQGFYKRKVPSEPVPEEYLEGPYVSKDEL